MAENATLSTRQRAAIESLLVAPNVRAAAADAGCNESTLYRYMQDPAFVGELRRRQRLILDATVNRLRQLAIDAVEAYSDALGDPSIHVRLRAADSVFAGLLKLTELVTIEERIERLEEAVNGQH